MNLVKVKKCVHWNGFKDIRHLHVIALQPIVEWLTIMH